MNWPFLLGSPFSPVRFDGQFSRNRASSAYFEEGSTNFLYSADSLAEREILSVHFF